MQRMGDGIEQDGDDRYPSDTKPRRETAVMIVTTTEMMNGVKSNTERGDL